MLSIFIQTNKQQGFLDIDATTQLSIETYTDIFDEDFTTGEISLPLEIPWTDNNRKLLGFAERLENFSNKPDYYICTVYDDMFPELTNAKFTILEKSGLFTYQKGKFNATISGIKGIFGSKIKNKNLKDLKLGGKIAWTGKDSREFAYDVMTGVYPEYSYIAFGPLVIENFFDKSRPDYTTEFMVEDTVNEMVIQPSGQWIFGRPTTVPGISSVATSGTANYIDYRTIPFFKVKYIITKIFEENGFTINGDFINDTDFEDLVLYNNYAIENYSPTTYVDFNRSINPANHLPDYSILDFLKAFFTFFNIYPIFSTAAVTFVYRKKEIANTEALDITPYVVADFTCTFENADAISKKGFTLKSNNSTDNYRSDWVKDITGKTFIGSIDSANQLGSISIGRTLTTDDICFIPQDNMYYQVVDATHSPVLWEVCSQKLGDFIYGDGERQVSTDMGTFCTNLYNTNGSIAGAYLLGWIKQLGFAQRCATRQPGSYINYKGVTVKNPFGLYIFYCKKINLGYGAHPATFTRARDYNGDPCTRYGLSFNGEDGIANFHKSWQQLRLKSDVVKTAVRVDKKILQQLSKTNKVQINNVIYLVYYYNKILPLRDIMEIRLVPL